MCSRYELIANGRELAARFRLTGPPPLPNRTDNRPTDLGLVLTPGGPLLLRWGLAVEWDTRPLINARAETLASKPTFRRLLGSRVLVPAGGWWEWRAEGEYRRKMHVRRPDGGLFAFAGLLDGEHFTLVTCAAGPSVAKLHHRMPVILPPEAEAPWLDPATPFDAVAESLAPYSGPLTITAGELPASPVQPGLFD